MPTKMMMVRNSERAAFKRCRHAWQWTYRDGRTAREAGTALRFGDLIHQALAAYRPPGRKFGPDPWLVYEKLYMEQAKKLGDEGFNVFSDEKWESAYDLGIGMLKAYVEEFREKDAEYEVISTEQTFQLVVRIRRQDAPHISPDEWGSAASFRFIVVGTFDGVWKHRKTKRVVFKEYKTAATIHEDGLAMDEQASLYWTYGPKWLVSQGILAEAGLIDHILYTFLRKAVKDDDRPQNAEGHYLNKPSKDALVEYAEEKYNPAPGSKPFQKRTVVELVDLIGEEQAAQLGEVSKTQPSPFFLRIPVYRDRTDRERAHARVCAEALDIARARAGGLALYKNPGPLHMPNCRFCSVREACEMHETGGDFVSVLNATTAPWNPYSSHELPERF